MKQNPLPQSALLRVLFSAVLIIFSLPACQSSSQKNLSNPQTITIGMEATAVNTLIFIAEAQHYFAANGLHLTIKEYPSGRAAVDGMLNNEVDIATASEFVIVAQALSGTAIRTFGSIDKFLHNYLIGRKDRGIQEVTDLRGKKIGVSLKTAAEFYLGRFLNLHGLNFEDVTVVDIPPTQLVNALKAGDVDAVIVWQPNAKTLVDQFGQNVVQWPVQNEQSAFCNLISTNTWIENHAEALKPLMNALFQAEDYNIHNPDQAKAIIQKRLQYDDAYMATIWPEHQFLLSLDQSLILSMEDEARWMINTGLVPQTQTPNFLDYLAPQPMQAIKPDAVNIIH